MQMLPPGGSNCGRLTYDLPLGCLQGGTRGSALSPKSRREGERDVFDLLGVSDSVVKLPSLWNRVSEDHPAFSPTTSDSPEGCPVPNVTFEMLRGTRDLPSRLFPQNDFSQAYYAIRKKTLTPSERNRLDLKALLT